MGRKVFSNSNMSDVTGTTLVFKGLFSKGRAVQVWFNIKD